jgi:opacity protein-like surface antigen
MKNLFLTVALGFATLFASAQNFMVVTTYNAPADGAEWQVSSLTDNMGVGYNLNDTWTVGVVNAGGEASYDLWSRYNCSNNVYVSVQAPAEEVMSNLTLGVGYSFNVWKGILVEPNYSMGLEEDENGERKGTFNLGLAYRF